MKKTVETVPFHLVLGKVVCHRHCLWQSGRKFEVKVPVIGSGAWLTHVCRWNDVEWVTQEVRWVKHQHVSLWMCWCALLFLQWSSGLMSSGYICNQICCFFFFLIFRRKKSCFCYWKNIVLLLHFRNIRPPVWSFFIKNINCIVIIITYSCSALEICRFTKTA